MKKYLIQILLLISTTTCLAQSHLIKFIHVGDELAPRGTTVISVEKAVKPNDKPLDSTFGRGIQTDLKTFNIIREIIKEKEFANPVNGKHGTNLDFYRIVDSDGFVLNLESAYYKTFFARLIANLEKAKADNHVIMVFKKYY